MGKLGENNCTVLTLTLGGCMNFLTREDVLEMDVPKRDKDLYLSCLDGGGELILVNETIDGYDIVMGFNDNGIMGKLPNVH